MNNKFTALIDGIGLRQVLLLLLMALPSTHGYSVLVGLPETWDNGTVAGWINYDAVNEQQGTLAVENTGLKITFRKQSIKSPPEEYIFEAGTNASQGKFTGNYLLGGVTGMCFRLLCDRKAEVSALLYNSETKRLWRYRVPDVKTGVWMVVQVPLTPVGMGSENGSNEWGALENDLRNVTWVGVSIERNMSMSLQVYRLDDFALQGVPEFGAWMAQFPHPSGYGAGECVALPEGDLDGDGVCNLDEWIAGSSAGDRTNVFRLALNTVRSEGIKNKSDNGVVLKWQSSANRKYCVWRSTNLAEGFVKLGNEEIDATPPENIIVDITATNNGPYFYKAEVRRID